MKDCFEIRQELDRVITEMYNNHEIIDCDTVFERFEPDIYYKDLLEFAANEPHYMERCITDYYYVFKADDYDYINHIMKAQLACAECTIEQAIEDFNIIDNELESIEE